MVVSKDTKVKYGNAFGFSLTLTFWLPKTFRNYMESKFRDDIVFLRLYKKN